jgi:rod shape-determining protein MreB
LAIGSEAKRMLGRTPAVIEAVRPLRDGVISDFETTEAMLRYFIQKVHQTPGGGTFSMPRIPKPRVVVGIPSGVTEVERRAVQDACLSAGARQAYLIEEPMAAAIGEGVSIFQPTGVMIVDIGGGTTEIAVLSLGGIVVSKSLRLAGQDMDRAIIHYVRLKHGLIMGEATAEEVKIKIGSAYQKNSKLKTQNSKVEEGEKEDIMNRMAVVRGRDIESGLPKSLRLTEVEIREALSPVLGEIIEEIAGVLRESPSELANDIMTHGILLTGGGSMLRGLDTLIVERTHMQVILSEDPLTSVVRGAGKVLEDEKLLKRVKVTGGLQ